MNKSKYVAALAVVLVGGSLAYLASQSVAAPGASSAKAEIGQVVPNFTLKDVYGKSFSLSDFKDKTVVLQWFNVGCPAINGCDERKVMAETYAKYAEKGVIWLAVDSTAGADAEKNRIYAAQKGLQFPILMDPDGKVGHMFGAASTPHMFVIDKAGKLVYTGAIDDNKQGDNEDPKSYVGAALDATLAGKAVDTPRTKSYGCGVKYARKARSGS